MISAVILTKNEEKNIDACLDSVKWCDETIIVDDYSTDNTVTRAKKKGAVIYQRHLQNDFSSQRNFGLEKASGDWILFLDADERVSLSLAYEMQTNTSQQIDHIDGYFIKRLDTIWGKQLKYGELGNITLLRLAREGKGQWKGRVHETWEIKNTATLQNALNHYPHQTITQFLHEINFYTTLRARELYDKKTSVTVVNIFIYPAGKFFVNYLFRLGFLDGVAGLLLAILMSFHSFLVRVKLWSLWAKKS